MTSTIKQDKIKQFFKDVFEKYPSANFTITYSEYEQPLQENLSIEEIVSKIETCKNNILFSFYVPDMEGKRIKKKILLEAKKCQGFQYRYSLEGWGLVTLQLKKLDSNYEVTCGGNSQARAKNWFATYPQYENPNLWNWQAVESCRRAINKIIKKHQES